MPDVSPHLRRLEAESIYIIREVTAAFAKPVMLYSIGKDSGVMLHLAMKAHYPSPIPFPLLHVDTGWKFRDMIRHRDMIAERYGVTLLVYTNADGVARGINPIASGSQLHTQVMKTEALKQALDLYGFDAAFGGARRDEEKSRAKERIFSFRSAGHVWDPTEPAPRVVEALQHPDPARASPFGCFRCRTGRSWTCGGTRAPSSCPSSRSTSRPPGRWWNGTDSSSCGTTTGCRSGRARVESTSDGPVSVARLLSAVGGR